ncbi:MAG: EpsI family protein [candidate division Zixibacteria bacterium]|nr:EpsI family protein [candidate division Zixibacteria bacterium]
MKWKKGEFWIIVGFFVLTAVLVNLMRYSRAESKKLPSFSIIPLEIREWKGEEFFFSGQTYELLKVDVSTLRRYVRRDGANLWFFISYFKSQEYGSQIHSPKHCLPGSGWKILKREKVRIDPGSGSSFKVNKLLIAEKNSREIMYYWFQTRGGVINSEMGLKLDLVFNALRRRPTDAAFIRINLPLGQLSEEEAQLLFEDFLRTFQPSIKKALPF